MINFEMYYTGRYYDELFLENNTPRPHTVSLVKHINALSKNDLKRRQQAAELALFQQGITFSVYNDKEGAEKIFPFDIIPRIIAANEWEWLEKGLKQRLEALNLFIGDVYHQQKILKDKVIPPELVLSSSFYLKQCIGLYPTKGIWTHIAGIDLVRDQAGMFYVLEDNLRCPSGISYVLENRSIQKKTFPRAFQAMNVRPVSNYSDYLYDTLHYIAPEHSERPNIIVLTPGVYNSAYFEHAYLARQMGVTLAEGGDLVVIDDNVMLHTTRGFEKVDVIYRRIDDDFLDPYEFRKDSILGVSGIMECYRKGNVTLVNAPGTGIADDKAIHAYVPQMIKYYLDQEAILPNVPTYLCHEKKQLQHVLKNIRKLVIKSVDQSGGYGMLIGPQATAKQCEAYAKKIAKNPRHYIAQPVLGLSRSPTIVGDHIEGRHVDLRPYLLYGKSIFVLPGGLTRVALEKGSLIVNSSQGGGSKDTWVLDN